MWEEKPSGQLFENQNSTTTSLFFMLVVAIFRFSKSCPLVVDFLRASGGLNSKIVLVESEET
jgi:hypothetical protein